MAVTRHELSGNLVDIIGQPLLDTWSLRRPRETRAWVETNLPAGAALVTTEGILLGPRVLDLDLETGVFTPLDLVATDSGDLTLPDDVELQYQVVVRYPNNVTRSLDTWASGWFDFTAAADLNTLAQPGGAAYPAAPVPRSRGKVHSGETFEPSIFSFVIPKGQHFHLEFPPFIDPETGGPFDFTTDPAGTWHARMDVVDQDGTLLASFADAGEDGVIELGDDGIPRLDLADEYTGALPVTDPVYADLVLVDPLDAEGWRWFEAVDSRISRKVTA